MAAIENAALKVIGDIAGAAPCRNTSISYGHREVSVKIDWLPSIRSLRKDGSELRDDE